MSISISSGDFSDFKLGSLPLKTTNVDDKIIINDNLILESDFLNSGELAITGSIYLRGGTLYDSGKIYLIKRKTITHVLDENLTENWQFTGFVLDSDIRDISITVIGPESTSINWSRKFSFSGNSRDSEFYFSSDGGKTASYKPKIGDSLFWNSINSGLSIYKTWRLVLEYI